MTLPRSSFAFRSAVVDEHCLAVVEVVLLVRNEQGVLVGKCGLGWTCLKLFVGPEGLRDVKDQGVNFVCPLLLVSLPGPADVLYLRARKSLLAVARRRCWT